MPETERTAVPQAERRRIVEAGGSVLANLRQGRDTELLAWARETGRYQRIDRRSKWGSPFRLESEGERPAMIERYRGYLAGRPELLADLDELRGKVLACWCYPKACHGDVLLDRLGEG